MRSHFSIINAVLYDIEFGKEKKFFILFFHLFISFCFLFLLSLIFYTYAKERLPLEWFQFINFVLFGLNFTFSASFALFSAVKLSRKKFQIISVIPLVIMYVIFALRWAHFDILNPRIIIFFIIPVLTSSSLIYFISFVRYYSQSDKVDKLVFAIFAIIWSYLSLNYYF